MDINLYHTPIKKKTSPIRPHLAELFDSPSPQPSPSTWWPGTKLRSSTSRTNKTMEQEMKQDDTLAPTTPSRLLLMPLSSSPSSAIKSAIDPIKTEIHGSALEEAHHTANSSPFDSDPDDDASKTSIESPLDYKLTSLLSPVIEQPEELFDPEQANSRLFHVNFTDSPRTPAEKASLESDLIQLENEISAETGSEDEHESSPTMVTFEKLTLLDDYDDALHTDNKDEINPLVPSPKQEDPDLIDFITPGVTVTEEELGASSTEEEETHDVGEGGKVLESSGEELVGHADDGENARDTQESLIHPANQAYGDLNELAVIMEEEEDPPHPADPSITKVAASMLEDLVTSELQAYQEHQQHDLTPLANFNSNNGHKAIEQIDSAMDDDECHAGFGREAHVEEEKQTSGQEEVVLTTQVQTVVSQQFVLVEVKEKCALQQDSNSLHFEEHEYSDYDNLQNYLAAFGVSKENDEDDNDFAKMVETGLSNLRTRSDSLQSAELPTQEELQRYLAALTSSADRVEGSTRVDIDSATGTNADSRTSDLDSTAATSSGYDNQERKLSVVLPPHELRFTAEPAMTPRDESWFIRSPTEEQRLEMDLPTMPDPMSSNQHTSPSDEMKEHHKAAIENSPTLPNLHPASLSIAGPHRSQQSIVDLMSQYNLDRSAGSSNGTPDTAASHENRPLFTDQSFQERLLGQIRSAEPGTSRQIIKALPSPAGWWEITLIPAWLPSSDTLKPCIPASPTKNFKKSLKSPRRDRRWKNNKSKHQNRPYQRPTPPAKLSEEQRNVVNNWRNFSANVEASEKGAFLAAQAEQQNNRVAAVENEQECKPVYHETFKQSASGERPGERHVVTVSKTTHTSDSVHPKEENNEDMATSTMLGQPKAASVLLPPAYAPALPEGEYDPWPTGLQEAVLARVSFVSPTRSTFEGHLGSASASPVGKVSVKADSPFSPATANDSSQPTTPSPSSFRHRRPGPPKELQFNEDTLRADISDGEEEENNDDWSATSATHAVHTPDADSDKDEEEPLLVDYSESSLEVKKRSARETVTTAAGSLVKYGLGLGVVLLLIWLGMSESVRTAVGHIKKYEVEYHEGRPKVVWKFGVHD